MDERSEPFTPETVDEQIDQLLQSRDATSPEAHVVQNLYRLSLEDAGSLDQVWHRLHLDTHMSFSDAVRQMDASQEETRNQGKMMINERKQHMLLDSNNHVPKRQLLRTFSVIAAVLVAALLVGSVLLVFHDINRSNQGPAASNITNQPQKPHQEEGKTPSGIYIGGDNGVARLDVKTGQQIWKYSYPATNFSGVLYSTKIIPLGSTVYVGMQSLTIDTSPAVLAIDVQTGRLRWSHTFDKMNLEDLTATSDMLYVGAAKADRNASSSKTQMSLPAPGTSTSTIYAFNAVDGRQRAAYQVGGDVQTLTIASNVLYFGASDGLHALSLSGGKQLWYSAVSGQNLSITTPSIVGDVLYTTITNVSEQGNQSTGIVAAFKTSTGEKLWQSDNIQSQLFGLTLANNKVFVGTMMSDGPGSFKGGLREYDAQSGKLAWKTNLDGAVEWAPAVANDLVYTPAYRSWKQQGEVVALNSVNGSVKWTAPVAAGIMAAPTVVNGVVYISTAAIGDSARGTLTAFKAVDGSKLWAITSNKITNIEALVVVA